jgi:transposase
MLIIGCDYHPSFQQIAFADSDTGEFSEKRLKHSDGEAESFYRELKLRGCEVRVGIEATGPTRWFERLLAELNYELWMGDPAQISAMRVRKQKTDRQDAKLLLKLLLEDRFPRVWRPSVEDQDLRQLLWHRHRFVQMRTRILNQLQAVAMNEGIRRKNGLWSKQGRAQLESLPLAPWTAQRREDLLALLDGLSSRINELSATLQQEAEKRPAVVRLMTHPGVGCLTALAFVLILGVPERFQSGKQVGSYVGLIPSEASSSDRRRLGHINKQGNSLLRFQLVEAAQAAVRCDPEWRRKFLHLALRREPRIAKVAMARKLAVSLYWMWRKQCDYLQVSKVGSHAG